MEECAFFSMRRFDHIFSERRFLFFFFFLCGRERFSSLLFFSLCGHRLVHNAAFESLSLSLSLSLSVAHTASERERERERQKEKKSSQTTKREMTTPFARREGRKRLLELANFCWTTQNVLLQKNVDATRRLNTLYYVFVRGEGATFGGGSKRTVSNGGRGGTATSFATERELALFRRSRSATPKKREIFQKGEGGTKKGGSPRTPPRAKKNSGCFQEYAPSPTSN